MEVENEHVEAMPGSSLAAEKAPCIYIYSSDEDQDDIIEKTTKTRQKFEGDEELSSAQRADDGLTTGITSEDEEETGETDNEGEKIMDQREEESEIEILSEDEKEAEAVPPIDVIDLSSDEEEEEDSEFEEWPEPTSSVSKRTEETVPATKDLSMVPVLREQVKIEAPKVVDCQTQTEEWSDNDDYYMGMINQDESSSTIQFESGTGTGGSTSTNLPSLGGKLLQPPIFIDLVDSDDEDEVDTGEKNKVKSTPTSPLIDTIERVEVGGAIIISRNNVKVVDVSDGCVECGVCGWITKNPAKHRVKYHPKSVKNEEKGHEEDIPDS